MLRRLDQSFPRQTFSSFLRINCIEWDDGDSILPYLDVQKVRKGLGKMTSALNQQSDNSVLGETGGNKIPADGTGRRLHMILVCLIDEL